MTVRWEKVHYKMLSNTDRLSKIGNTKAITALTSEYNSQI